MVNERMGEEKGATKLSNLMIENSNHEDFEKL